MKDNNKTSLIENSTVLKNKIRVNITTGSDKRLRRRKMTEHPNVKRGRYIYEL